MGVGVLTHNLDPFKNQIRKYIPLDEYWDMVQYFEQGSLKTESVFDTLMIEDRIVVLTEAEEKEGFVHEGELHWLTALVNGNHQGSYADWVRRTIDTLIVNEPLRWAALECLHAPDLDQGYDVWAALVSQSGYRLLPFDLIPELRSNDFFSDPALGIYGKRDTPSPSHLIKMFELLHNLPYYVLEHRDQLTYGENETEYTMVELTVLDPDDAEAWEVTQDNMYSACDSRQFRGRIFIPWEFQDRQKMIRDAAEAANDKDWEELKKAGVTKPPSRIIDRYANEIPEYKVHRFADDDWPDGKRKTGAVLRNATVTCSCGEHRDGYLEFAWGSCVDWRSYEFGDPIHWSLHSVGFRDVGTVFVQAKTETTCPSCDRVYTGMLRIENDRIEALDVTVGDRVEYDFLQPFVEVNGELISWEVFQSNVMIDLVNRVTDRFESSLPRGHAMLIRLLETTSRTLRKSRKAELAVQWFFADLKQYLTPEEYWQALVFANAKLYGDEEFSIESRVKSSAVFEREGANQRIDWYSFRWGTMLDFPHYRLGDQIQWSEYSYGEPGLPLVYVKTTHLEWSGYFFLKIERDVITEIVTDVESIEYGFRSSLYDTYVDGKPYHIGAPE